MTQFRDGFMKASPVKQIAGDRAERLRKRAQRKSERSGETGGYNYSDPKVLKLLDKAKKIENKNFIKSTGAKKGSKRKGSRYGEDARVSASYERPDMDTSPLNGYVDGEERASHYQPTADLYQGLIDTMMSSVDKIAESKSEEEKDSFKKAGKRVDEIADAGVDYKFGKTLNNGINLNDGVNSFGGKYAVTEDQLFDKSKTAFQKYLKS